MYLNDKIRDAMVKGMSAEELREIAKKNGMISLGMLVKLMYYKVLLVLKN